MGVSVYPVLNKTVPGFDVTEVSGKLLADVMFEEGSIFGSLMRFSSDNEDELAAFISDQTGQDAAEIDVPKEEWFAPEEGLKVMRTLLEQVSANSQYLLNVPEGWEPDEFTEGLIADLRNIEGVLVLAQKHQALFHLALDF